VDQTFASPLWHLECVNHPQGVEMKLFQDLFFTDYGLMSFLGIMFMPGMAVFFIRLFTKDTGKK
jgi:hypothetical protein